VARAAANEVVNIVRGGAVVPVIRASVARCVAQLAGRHESALIAAELLTATRGMT